MISTTVETDKPELEIKPALELLGDVLEMFVRIDTIQVPTDDGRKDNVRNIILTYLQLYVTKSYDPTSHFEEASNEVLEMYERIVGEKLDLNIEPTDEEEY